MTALFFSYLDRGIANCGRYLAGSRGTPINAGLDMPGDVPVVTLVAKDVYSMCVQAEAMREAAMDILRVERKVEAKETQR